MAYLELQNLQRNFGPVKALDGIEIQLGEGEFLSLLGPSGCGKTTALRLVAGFDRPDGGRIVVDGKDITNVSPNKRDMGMVFQAYSLFPNMTARQNVEYGLRIRGKEKADRRKRVDDLLELVGLGHAGDRYPHQLSGGMQQRVALARASGGRSCPCRGSGGRTRRSAAPSCSGRASTPGRPCPCRACWGRRS